MTQQRNKADQYLQRVGGVYYARVRVPRSLEKYTGQTHIRRTLETGDRTEANRRKHAVVARIKGELERLRKAPTKPEERGISFAEAKLWREELIAAESIDDEGTQYTTVLGAAIDKAEQMERLYGTDKASRWYKAATTTTDTLAELMERWLHASEYKASTNAGHRKALAELLSFVKDDHAGPAAITRKTAVAYIENDLTQRGLAHATIRDRLVSLGGFWKWMASRDAVTANPWSGHKFSKQHNKGRSPPKRKFTEDELLRLLAGNARVWKWPTYSYFPDLMILGLFTGAREEELCSLTANAVEMQRRLCFLDVKDAKTEAGIRFVAVTHPAPMAVLRRRLKGIDGAAQVFPELKPGGLDRKFSASVAKAFTRYRRACDVPDGTDFHSFRRNVNTVLEEAGVTQVDIARFVGQKIGTISGDVYVRGGSRDRAARNAAKIRYESKIEAAALALSAR